MRHHKIPIMTTHGARFVLILACALGGCGSRQSDMTSRITETPPKKERVEPKVEPKVEPRAQETDPDKQAFIELVKEHADDPRNLEIVRWGEKKADKRSVAFRCAKIGDSPGAYGYSLTPVSFDTAVVEYDGDRMTGARLQSACRVIGNTMFNYWRPHKGLLDP